MIGEQLGPYQVVAKLGAGGMGEVWRARDTRLGRDVAIKVLHDSVAADPERRERFEREARAIAALSHPNILAIFDIGEHEGQLYVVTELLEGQTLRDRLADGPMPFRKVVDLGVQVAKGLTAAHDRGIIHRDLKPENLFCTTDGLTKILDFGLARQLTSAAASGATETMAATDPGTILGTVGYMAPNKSAESRLTGGLICLRSGPCCTKRRRATARSRATRRPTRSPRFCVRTLPRFPRRE